MKKYTVYHNNQFKGNNSLGNMQTKGLALSEKDIENSSKLVSALKELPDGSIEGLSEYDPSYVFFEGSKIVIKRPVAHGDPLTVNFPEGSTNNVARYGIASFEYHRRLYEIHQ